MFGDISSSLGELSLEDRLNLAQYYIKRNHLMKQTVAINELKITNLTNPSPELEERLAGIQSTIIDPLVHSLREETVKLLKDAIDVDGLKSLLPMVLSGVLQHVNLAMMLAIAGINPDQIKDAIEDIKDYLSSD